MNISNLVYDDGGEGQRAENQKGEERKRTIIEQMKLVIMLKTESVICILIA